MSPLDETYAAYLELGSKRVFAGAPDWPGWCRSARDEAAALEALVAYGSRYAQALDRAGVVFRPPGAVTELGVEERLAGNATTDFGSPDRAPEVDALPVGDAELRRLQAILTGCWRAFDSAAQAAAGIALRLGPRGGGRSLERISLHVLEAEGAYLGRLAVRHQMIAGEPPAEAHARIRSAILEALERAAHGELPAAGPRGGAYWTPRYFVRRVAWHALDHAWEIEDRAE